MILFPAIDLYEKKAVRLLRGDYAKMTVYSDHPPEIALDFKKKGVTHIHLVDLEGAKTGETPNFETVLAIKKSSDLFCEIGGGIRSMDTVERYLNAGIDRVILGTAAVQDEAFLCACADRYGDRIAVGVDLKDGFVAIKGWTQTSDRDAYSFCARMQQIGIRTLICTDISKDGAMQGTNVDLYRALSERFSMQIEASGGVSSLDDVKKLRALNLYGAIIGKAYYTGAIDLAAALEAAK